MEEAEELQKDLKRVSRSGLKGVSATKCGELEDALEAYRKYQSGLHGLFGEMASAIGEAKLYDQAVADRLKGLLKAARKLSGEVTELSEGFIQGNKQISSARFDPSVLDVPDAVEPELDKQIAAAQQAEKQRQEQEAAAAAAAEAERQRQEQEKKPTYVTCPHCGGTGISEGGDGWYVCPFCGGSGVVTPSKAATYNPWDWI